MCIQTVRYGYILAINQLYFCSSRTTEYSLTSLRWFSICKLMRRDLKWRTEHCDLSYIANELQARVIR